MKKAKIDVLDIADSLEENPEIQQEIQTELHSLAVEEPQIDLQSESFLVAQEQEETPARRFLTWKTLIIFGIPSFCLILAVVAALFYFLSPDKKAAPAASKEAKGRTVSAPGAPGAGPVYFDNLTAVINDSSGNQRLVMFGIAVAPGKGTSLNFSGSDQSVRFAASKVVCDLPFSDIMSDQGRDRAKKRIKAHVEYLKGSGMIETVWITSWTVL